MATTIGDPKILDLNRVNAPLRTLGAFSAMGAMVAGTLNPDIARFFEFVTKENASHSGASADWLLQGLPSMGRGADYPTLAQKVQQNAPVLASSRDAASPEAALLRLKREFSLTALQLAAVMHVSRAALYKWLDGGTQMRPDKFKRLHALEAMAHRWHERAGKPMGRVHGLSRGAREEIVRLLTSRAPDAMAELERTLDEHLARLSPRTPSMKSLSEIESERGWEPLPPALVRANLDHTIPTIRLGDDC